MSLLIKFYFMTWNLYLYYPTSPDSWNLSINPKLIVENLGEFKTKKKKLLNFLKKIWRYC